MKVMENKRQFSLAYLFLEIFWIAATLAFARQAYWVWYRYYRLSDYDTWFPPESALFFVALVIASLVCCGTAIGGLFKRMRLGAVAVVSILVGIAVFCLLLTPSVQ